MSQGASFYSILPSNACLFSLQFAELVSRANGSFLSKWTQSKKPQFIFELVYNDEQETKFQSIAGSHGIMLTYHGSSVENFHSIVHNGLLNLFNKVCVCHLQVRVGSCALV